MIERKRPACFVIGVGANKEGWVVLSVERAGTGRPLLALVLTPTEARRVAAALKERASAAVTRGARRVARSRVPQR